MEQSVHTVHTVNGVTTDSWTEVRPQYASLECLPNCPTKDSCDTERTPNCPRLRQFGLGLVGEGVLSRRRKINRFRR